MIEHQEVRGLHGHHEIVCEGCGTRLGGCRCIEGTRTRIPRGLCTACADRKRESGIEIPIRREERP